MNQTTTRIEQPPPGYHPRRSIRRWLPYITWEGAFANVFIVGTGGAFLTGMALLLGASDFEIGLLGAIPFLAQLAQICSAYLMDRNGGRKSLTLVSIAIARQSWWLVIPLLLLPGSRRLEFFILIVTVSSVATMVATPGWMSWMADLVPEGIRGRYFGRRNAAVSVTTMVVTVAGGIILDRFHAINLEAAGFAVLVGASCLFALAAVLLLRKVPDTRLTVSGESFSLSRLLEPFMNPTYRRLIKVFFMWNVATGIAAVFFAAHMLTNLKMTFTQIALYTSVTSIVAILLNKPWGSLIDRFGSKPVIVLTAFGIAFVPIIWLFPRAGHLWILAFESVYSGALWTGFNLGAFNLPIAVSPKEGRTTYLATFAVITGLAFFASCIVGGMIAETFAGLHWRVGAQTIVNYHLLFVISSVLRLLAAFLMTSFHEPREKRFPIMIQFMGYAFLKRISVGRQILPFPFRRSGEK